MIGVYQIKNTVDGKVYIGSTAMSFERRWTAHRTALKKGYHYNKHLQRAWIKYGESAFSFDVLEIVENPADIHDTELKWISKYFGKNCYNATNQYRGMSAKFQKSEIVKCLQMAIDSGCKKTEQLHNFLREHIGDVREYAMINALHEMGYRQVPAWEKKGK